MNNRGFSLIEALIAVAILGLSLSALLALRHTVLKQLHIATTLEAADTDTRNAMAMVADVNPMKTPEGAREIRANQSVTWRAQRISSVRRTEAYPAGAGDHEVALFRLHVSVVTAGRTTAEYDVERLGWRDADVSRQD